MAAPWYTPSGTPGTASAGSSAAIRAEFALIETALDKLPALTADSIIAVDAGGTALVPKTAAQVRTLLGLVIGTNVQAEDPLLTAIAGLTTAADQMIYSTGSDAVAMAGLTAFARTVLDDADAPTMRATLGLVIGTNVQAYDALLQALAGLTTANNQMIYATGVDTFAMTPLTAFARTILDDASEAAFKATVNLEIGVDIQAWDAQLDVLAGYTVIDDDSMATASATSLPSSESVKAYVDNNAAIPARYIQPGGLILSNDAGDTAHDINVTAGLARNAADDANIDLTTEITKQIDATWAAGDDAGGRSSSVSLSADTWYHVFVVLIGGSPDVLFDTSITCANGITDHTVTDYRYLGSVLTDGSSNIIRFDQYEGTIWWRTTPDSIINAISGTAANHTLAVPPNLPVIAIVDINITSSGDDFVRIYHPNGTDEAVNDTNSTLSVSSAGEDACRVHQLTNTSSQIRSRSGDALGGSNIHTVGWQFDRGAQ